MYRDLFKLSHEGLPDAGEVRAAQMASFSSLTLVNAFITVTAVLFVAALLWPVAPRSWVAAWAGAHVWLSSTVAYGAIRRGSSPPKRSVSVRGLRRAVLWAAVAGVLWGSGAAFLATVPVPQQLALIIVIGAMAAGASSTLGAVPQAAALFVLGALTPPAIYFVLQGEPVYFALSALALVMAFGMIASARVVYRSFIEALKAKQANAVLLEHIRAERQDWLEISDTTEAFALFDADDKLLLWNESYRRIFELPADLLSRGRRRRELLRKGAVPVEVAEGRETLDAWIDAQTVIRSEQGNAAVELLTTGRWVRSRARRTSAGRTIMVFVDVTEIKMAEERLQQSQKMEAIGLLTGGIAHDFNNQLMVIMGNLEFLKERVANDPSAVRYIEVALIGAIRSAELTQRLLAFARRQPLSPRIGSIEECVAGSVRLIERTLGEDIAVEFTAEESWQVLVDEAQLSACIINLASNARDAMPDGGDLAISIRNARLDRDYMALHPGVKAGEYVLLEVSDTGVGMTPEVLARVFDPFFTTKEIGQGSGLGLSMVHGFVKQSGGQIEIGSVLGRGTTVRIYLPRSEEKPVSDASASIEPSHMLGGRETILVVEDDAGVRQTAITRLSGLGYRVLEAADGEAAIAILDRLDLKIDLLFTDVVMPGKIDGYALARAAAVRRPGLRVLLSSGFPGRRPDTEVERRSDLHLLPKPYFLDDLARAIRKTLDCCR